MIKLEKQEVGNITRFKFQCNSSADHETLDKLRVAILSGHPKRGDYEDSNTFILEAIIPVKTLPEKDNG
jgi:hypothetical protein